MSKKRERGRRNPHKKEREETTTKQKAKVSTGETGERSHRTRQENLRSLFSVVVAFASLQYKKERTPPQRKVEGVEPIHQNMRGEPSQKKRGAVQLSRFLVVCTSTKNKEKNHHQKRQREKRRTTAKKWTEPPQYKKRWRNTHKKRA